MFHNNAILSIVMEITPTTTRFATQEHALSVKSHKGKYNMITETPRTSVLVDQDGRFDSFGHVAEDRYEMFAKQGTRAEWRLFQNFDIIQNECELSTEACVKDTEGRPAPATEICGFIMRYFLNQIVTGRLPYQNRDIVCVIPVPKAECDTFKEFWCEVKNQTGLNEMELVVVSFGDAAISAVLSPRDDKYKPDITISPGTKIMVIDVGDNSSSVTCLQKRSVGSYRELMFKHLGPCCMDTVFEAALDFFSFVFGEERTNNLKDDDFQLYCLYDEIKHHVKMSNTDSSKVYRIKYGAFNPVWTKADMDKSLLQLHLKTYVTFVADKLYLHNSIFKSWLNVPVLNIVDGVRCLLARPEFIGVETIVFVGTFLRSKYVKESLKSQFSDKTVLIPPTPEYTVLDGAADLGFTIHKRPNTSSTTLSL